jgi:hypothetical protein
MVMPILEIFADGWDCFHPDKLGDQTLTLEMWVDLKTIAFQIKGEPNEKDLEPSVEVQISRENALFIKNFIDAFLNSNA